MKYLFTLLLLTGCCDKPDWYKVELRQRQKAEAIQDCGSNADGIYELDGKYGCVYLTEKGDPFAYEPTLKAKVKQLWDVYNNQLEKQNVQRRRLTVQDYITTKSYTELCEKIHGKGKCK